jgi:hypothetical protein
MLAPGGREGPALPTRRGRGSPGPGRESWGPEKAPGLFVLCHSLHTAHSCASGGSVLSPSDHPSTCPPSVLSTGPIVPRLSLRAPFHPRVPRTPVPLSIPGRSLLAPRPRRVPPRTSKAAEASRGTRGRWGRRCSRKDGVRGLKPSSGRRSPAAAFGTPGGGAAASGARWSPSAEWKSLDVSVFPSAGCRSGDRDPAPCWPPGGRTLALRVILCCRAAAKGTPRGRRDQCPRFQRPSHWGAGCLCPAHSLILPIWWISAPTVCPALLPMWHCSSVTDGPEMPW